MDKKDSKYLKYVQLLEEELIPAMGCTEPIALAYAAATAREVLGCLPDKVLLEVSGSIIKNVKGVIVPNTAHLKGIKEAAAAGIVAGKAEKELEVIADATKQEIAGIKDFLKTAEFEVRHIEEGHIFDIIVTEYKGENYAKVRISDFHTNIVLIEKDGKVLRKKEADSGDANHADRSWMNMEEIWDFANTVDIEDVKDVLERQISYNCAIAEEGMTGTYGANVGKTLLEMYGDNILTRAKAKAAAGSDARMNGCEMPVVINSGSGNQGITCSVPVIEYAKELGIDHETLLRALALSNLTAIHEKTGIGTLSAYCGAVSAGSGAGAGIVYLLGGSYEDVIHTVTNSLATVSGMVCDGAKSSCAAKIAESIDAALLAYNLCKNGRDFNAGDGIIMKDIESTICGVGRIGKEGMRETNDTIINLMISE